MKFIFTEESILYPPPRFLSSLPVVDDDDGEDINLLEYFNCSEEKLGFRLRTNGKPEGGTYLSILCPVSDLHFIFIPAFMSLILHFFSANLS